MAKINTLIILLLLSLFNSSGLAQAQFGFDRAIKKLKMPRVERVPKILRKEHFELKRLDRHLGFRKTLGAVAVAAVGVTILESLNRTERREVAKRTTRIITADPDKEVVETYTTKNKSQKVTIKASPRQPASAFKYDEALTTPQDPTQPAPTESKEKTQNSVEQVEKNASKNTAGQLSPVEPAAPQQPAAIGSNSTSDSVKYAELPETTSCRKVETKLEPASSSKTGESNTKTSTAIICEVSAGDWKPTTL